MSENFVTKKEFEEYKKTIEKKYADKDKKPKVQRAPNDYNIFIKKQIVELKKENPKMTNVVAFQKCAEIWNEMKKEKLEKLEKEKLKQ